MKLVERHIIKRTHQYYHRLLDQCKKSNNLYNSVLYVIRQHYYNKINKQFDNDIASHIENKVLSYYDINSLFKRSRQQDYYSLPINVSQEVIKQVCQNFNSFFKLLKLKQKCEYNKQINIPKYKKNSYNICIYNISNLSKVWLRKKLIHLPNTNIYLPIKHKDNATQVKIVPRNGYIVYDIIYEQNEQKLKDDNKRYMSIDLGVNNLATCTSNVIPSFIINGKPIKAINQYYNKKKSKLQLKSNKLKRLSLKRNNKIDWYFHNSTKYIVNQLVSNNINTLIVGKSNNWKQDINIGTINNQKISYIPFNKFIHQLEYKCKLNGINFIIQEESYTSKMSFLDNDYIPIYGVDDNKLNSSGKRIKRGLFKSKENHYINADINGSLNIMKKYLNVVSDSIISEGNRGLIVSPIRISF